MEDNNVDDYYSILGLGRDASASDITKAYRKLARENHPDRGGSTETFQKLNEAYSTLKDPKKRRQYDLLSSTRQSGVDPEDLGTMFARNFFGSMMSSIDPRRDRRRQSTRSRRKRAIPTGDDKVSSVEYKIPVTLQELYLGMEKSFRIKRKRIVYPEEFNRHNCFVECEECEGYGRVSTVKRLGNVVQSFTGPCNACGGKGYDTKRGYTVVQETKILTVNIEAGMQNMDRIVVENAGDESVGNLPGDIIFIIEEKRHETYLREKKDLMIKLKISLEDALCGINTSISRRSKTMGSEQGNFVHIEHLDGRKIFLKSYPGDVIKPGCARCIFEEGMRSRYGASGNLFIIFDVEFPHKLELMQIKGLKNAFQLNQKKSTAQTDAGGSFLSSFFRSKRAADDKNKSHFYKMNENDKSNDIDQAWFDGENDDGVSDFNLNTHCIRYLEVTTIEDFGKSLPETNANKNLKNSRL
eukprot:g5801.t1